MSIQLTAAERTSLTNLVNVYGADQAAAFLRRCTASYLSSVLSKPVVYVNAGVRRGLQDLQELPSLTSGLAAWYRGDSKVITGSGVSEWTDKSGNGLHVLQGTDSARPPVTDPDSRFGNRASLNPDGTADFLKASAASSNFKFLHDGTGMTVVAVVYPTLGTTGSRVILDTCNASGSNVGFCMFRAGTSDSNGTLTTVVAASGVNAISHTTSAGAFNNGAAHVIAFTYQEGRSPEWELRIDRNATASGNSTAAPNTDNPLDTLCVGRLTTSTLLWRGAIAELSLIARASTTAQLQELEAHVLAYFGV